MAKKKFKSIQEFIDFHKLEKNKKGFYVAINSKTGKEEYVRISTQTIMEVFQVCRSFVSQKMKGAGSQYNHQYGGNLYYLHEVEEKIGQGKIRGVKKISDYLNLTLDYSLKNPLPANQVFAGTKRNLWWKCSKCGHEWEAPGWSRVSGRGCNSCFGRVVNLTNNLAITHPELAKEYSLRNILPPTQVVAGTGKKLWWKCCKCGYDWEALGSNRVNGNGCSACAGRVVISTNNLAVTHLELAKEYSTKNILTASQVIAGTNKKLWWKCNICEHEWEAAGSSRVKGSGCPKYQKHPK